MDTVFSAAGATVGATASESELRMVSPDDMKKVEGFEKVKRERNWALIGTIAGAFGGIVIFFKELVALANEIIKLF